MATVIVKGFYGFLASILLLGYSVATLQAWAAVGAALAGFGTFIFTVYKMRNTYIDRKRNRFIDPEKDAA